MRKVATFGLSVCEDCKGTGRSMASGGARGGGQDGVDGDLER